MNKITDRKRKLNREKGTTAAVIISITISVIAIISCITYLLAFNESTMLDVFRDKDKKQLSDNPDLNTGYVEETKYIGGIGYPEVYDKPFKKTDGYIMNKVFIEKYPAQAKSALASARGFIEAVFASDYRTIQEDPEGYAAEINKYLNPTAYYDEYEEENVLVADEYASAITEYLEDHKIACEAKFLTDDSLVYEDGYTYVRGILELTLYNIEGESEYFNFEKGKTQPIMVEIRLMRTDENPYDLRVYDIHPAAETILPEKVTEEGEDK